MTQLSLFNSVDDNNSIKNIGKTYFVEFDEKNKSLVRLFKHDILLKQVDISDKAEFRLFIIELVELKAEKTKLATIFDISRQTIHNYENVKKHFGVEGLVNNYYPKKSKSLRKQRELYAPYSSSGNKARILEQMRSDERKKLEGQQTSFDFSFEYSQSVQKLSPNEEPYESTHNWKPTRYAGVFTYLIALVSRWKWLYLLIGHFGSAYKIFFVFLLMVVRNIQSIEALKNVRSKEAGLLLGLKKLPSKPKIWEWFYTASHLYCSKALLLDYFAYQIRQGLVGTYMWFSDGHLLPYTGKNKVHKSYNTQRRLAVPGQTNFVTTDIHGRIVNFEIHEGKGNFTSYILSLPQKYKEANSPFQIFDREVYGFGFFYRMVKDGKSFVTWEKNVNTTLLNKIDDEKFSSNFKLHGKLYRFFEEDKTLIYIEKNGNDTKKYQFTLRHIFIWNVTTNHRTSGFAHTEETKVSTEECVYAILNRWGASENTFKHIKERHPYHYHPGFKLTKSENQMIPNPHYKEITQKITTCKSSLEKLYKKNLQKGEVKLNKDGTPRKNSPHTLIKNKIKDLEKKLIVLKEEKKNTLERINTSELSKCKSIKKVDNEGKYLFDFVTTSAWNVRKLMIDWLETFYKQKNEVVDLFYAITHCHGWIKSTAKEVTVRLEPLEIPARKNAQIQLCRKLSDLKAKITNGKVLVIEVGDKPNL